MLNKKIFMRKGWSFLPADAARQAWAQQAAMTAKDAVRRPEYAHWLQCENTWFVGVDVLENDHLGRVNNVALGQATEAAIDAVYPERLKLHRAQVSVIYPGYPRPRSGETEAAFRYRQKRDAAHVDGLRLDRESGARRCAEYHAYVIGLPLTEASTDASPLVVWEGSHKIMQEALAAALKPHAQERWPHVDISETYKAARRHAFETCPRVEVSAAPGEAYILHRHLLHGVAAWSETARAGSEGRMIAYFRPEIPAGISDWIAL